MPSVDHKAILSFVLRPYIILPLTAIVWRYFSFFPTVIDHDESTYMVIAKEILQGKTYLVDLIDTKPVGIFLIYALFELIGGFSIWILRLMAALWIGGTAVALFYLVRWWLGSFQAAWASALTYITLTSVFTFYGIVPNTEIYFNLFTVGALFLVLKRRHLTQDMAAGLLLGVGFMIKYMILFDAAAIAFFMLWSSRTRWSTFISTLGRGAVMLVAFCVPFALTWWYYHDLGLSETFKFYSFEVTRRYPVEAPLGQRLLFVLDFMGRFLPATLAVFFVLWRGQIMTKDRRWFFLVWLALDLVAILAPGKLFGHYFIQLMVPVSLVCGYFYYLHPHWPRWLKSISPRVGWSLFAFLMVVNLYFQYQDYYVPPDQPRLVANYLRKRLNSGEVIYTGSYHHILYLLLDLPSPSRFVHRSLLWTDQHIQALQIDTALEMQHILEQQPRFVLQELKPDRPDRLSQWLTDYRVVDTLFDAVIIYDLNP